MKHIPLTQNQFAIVDDDMFDYLSQWKWHVYWCKWTKSYYTMRHSKTINSIRHRIYMAREILGLKYGDKRQGDHINHDTLDNQRSNLRIVTKQQNQWNQKNPKGYSWDSKLGKYHAYLRVNGKSKHLGYFSNAIDAHEAYLQGKLRYHCIKALKATE